MIKVKKDLTGKTFGRLTVLYQVEDYVSPTNGRHKANWMCKCSCEEDKFVTVIGTSLTSGNASSCGCLQKEKATESNQKRFKGNKYDLSGEFGIGWTENTNNEFYFDLEDYDLIKDFTWYEDVGHNDYHSLKSRDRKTGKLVRFHHILGCYGYDHKDRNPLNNRRSNLRKATTQENVQNSSKQKNNTSGFIGVSWKKDIQKWTAYIIIDKTQKHLGDFINKKDAIRTRLKAEVKYFGEFAPQRHLFEQYGIVNNL